MATGGKCPLSRSNLSAARGRPPPAPIYDTAVGLYIRSTLLLFKNPKAMVGDIFNGSQNRMQLSTSINPFQALHQHLIGSAGAGGPCGSIGFKFYPSGCKLYYLSPKGCEVFSIPTTPVLKARFPSWAGIGDYPQISLFQS